jgi:PIN domain nuclease of toxin-antitoxin system
MKILVDTHAFFWWVNDSPQLSARARDAMSASATAILISAVVAWELATKARVGKWPEAAGLAADIAFVLQRYEFSPLPITLEHARLAGFLPGAHRDPFDRMLAAQAQIEDVPLVTADPAFRSFGTRVLW